MILGLPCLHELLSWYVCLANVEHGIQWNMLRFIMCPPITVLI
uniref:Uncharacterized protein n=1 Tax=Rhizophora mucronata TaxID=61149 RepID=A0A2P2J4S6_RHIMU